MDPGREGFIGLWSLDPAVTFLNHGSYGACPIKILEAQDRYRRQLETEPVQFFLREQEPAMDRARRELATFVGADPDDVVFVHNATSGVNSVLRSLILEPGQELLATNHGYAACRNSLEWTAARWGARVTVAEVPFPIGSPEMVLEAVLGKVSSRTKLALLDHVTSPTGLVFPIARLVAELERRGVETLVDGAHAPGMVPLDLRPKRRGLLARSPGQAIGDRSAHHQPRCKLSPYRSIFLSVAVRHQRHGRPNRLPLRGGCNPLPGRPSSRRLEGANGSESPDGGGRPNAPVREAGNSTAGSG